MENTCLARRDDQYCVNYCTNEKIDGKSRYSISGDWCREKFAKVYCESFPNSINEDQFCINARGERTEKHPIWADPLMNVYCSQAENVSKAICSCVNAALQGGQYPECFNSLCKQTGYISNGEIPNLGNCPDFCGVIFQVGQANDVNVADNYLSICGENTKQTYDVFNGACFPVPGGKYDNPDCDGQGKNITSIGYIVGYIIAGIFILLLIMLLVALISRAYR